MTEIRIVGAHSTGKTTLARWVSRTYGIPLIDEVAREVLLQMGGTIAGLRSDPLLVDRYQESVMRIQLEKESAQTGSWVSDRSVDCIAYTVAHAPGAMDFISELELERWVARIRAGYVFLCRPDPAILEDDGVRETPDWVGVNRIDASVEMLLDRYHIPWMPLPGPSFVDRTRAVSYIIDPILARADRNTVSSSGHNSGTVAGIGIQPHGAGSLTVAR
jgi:nicotinamide riboside kinase